VKLVLASRSPQRKAILEQLGIAFEIVVPEVDEVEEGDAVEVARENARRKAAAADGDAVIGVDTVVTLDGAIYGKPQDALHAREMLSALSGRTHTVVSGLALRRGDRLDVVEAQTRVRFRPENRLVDWYLPHEEWRERAGGYAIQGRGAAFVEWIDGDYLNVVGLPVAALIDLWPELLRVAR
jgi:septum formation protein